MLQSHRERQYGRQAAAADHTDIGMSLRVSTRGCTAVDPDVSAAGAGLGLAFLLL